MPDIAGSESSGTSESMLWIDQREACRLLGTSVGMFEYWTRRGQITTGRWAPKPGGGRCRLYARAEIERLVGTIRERREGRAGAGIGTSRSTHPAGGRCRCVAWSWAWSVAIGRSAT